MDYPVQRSAISVSVVLVLPRSGQTEADDRYTHTTTVGVSNYHVLLSI